MRPTVLVTKRVFDDRNLELLAPYAEVDYASSADVTAEELVERARGKQAIICQLTDKLSGDVIRQLDGPKLIAQIAVGYDNIDVAAATECGILVTNLPGVVTEATADLAFALMLAAARRIPEAHNYVKDRKWKRWEMHLLVGPDVHGATLGILGMGAIGQAMARRAKGFSMRILYHNRKRLDPALEQEFGAQWVTKEELLKQSDFVTVHTPLTPETRHSISEAEFRLMKPTAIFVNSSRGPVVDEEAMVKALKEKWIAGAGLDVFEKEPAVHPGLFELDNVVMAPHIGSATIATRTNMTRGAVENVLAYLKDQRPPNLLNPAVWEMLAAKNGVRV